MIAMARSALYSVTAKKRDCKVQVLARDPDAKQVLFGWGSDHGPSREFYGRGTRRGSDDYEVWSWKLSPAGIAELKKNLRMQLRQPKRFEVTPRENKAARQLLKKIEKAGRQLKSCRMR